jgi:tetratricopeptide (TPR) repeat protein
MALNEAALQAIEALCERLSERMAVLFLGAGVNTGSRNDAGDSFPLGQGLSDWLCRDLLKSPGLNTTLDEAAEMARFRLGTQVLNDYLYREFSRFRPATAHLATVQIPWDVIYTTNFDLLIESASKAPHLESAGRIRPIFSIRTDLSGFTEADVLYYKLHGSVDYANTEEGRLIVTKEDYRHYELHRKPLFKRLENDLVRRMFLFAGYSLRDPNFRGVLEDCKEIIGLRSFPLSFALRPAFSDVEAVFWKEKYNVQLIDSDADEFLNALKDTWIAQGRRIVPLQERQSRAYAQVDSSTRFRKIGESFYVVAPEDCSGASNPRLFFRGAEPTWGDIRDRIAPTRDAYWTLLDALFPELADPLSPASLYLITGAAGTGKTTLIRSLAFDLSTDFKLLVLAHIPGTPLDARLLGAMVDERKPARILVLVRHGAEYVREVERFMRDVTDMKLPVSLIVEERKNQWMSARSHAKSKLSPAEIELGSLSDGEISRILDALSEHNVLGKLTEMSQEYQKEHFTALAHKELLVALRELTSEGRFDDIIRDEFDKIPSETARRAYLYVSALGQVDLAIRYETLVHVLGVGFGQLAEEVFNPAEGILISAESVGNSRHNAGFRVSARHPIIASVIFSVAAPDDDTKFEIINRLLTHLDPGYREDRRLLDELVRKREFVGTFASPDKRRAVYDRLATLLPGDPYVLQHRALLERELREYEASIRFAREALRLDRANPAFSNTLGLALESAARDTQDQLRREALLAEATRIFDDNVRRDPGNPYGYIGKFFVLRQRADRAVDAASKAVLQASALSVLEEAYESTNESTIIAAELGVQRDRFGQTEDAIAVLKAGIDKEPTDERLRDLWIRLEIDAGRSQEALRLALEGVRVVPTSWRLQRHVARLKRRAGDAVESVRGHYEAAIRYKRGDVALMVELAAFLFTSGLYDEARDIFAQTKELQLTGFERSRLREHWRDGSGRDVVFSGRVRAIRGAAAFVLAIPQNFEAFFWRTRSRLQNLREGDSVQFVLGFNALGPTARIVE